jgi:hypothetical protein
MCRKLVGMEDEVHGREGAFRGEEMVDESIDGDGRLVRGVGVVGGCGRALE